MKEYIYWAVIFHKGLVATTTKYMGGPMLPRCISSTKDSEFEQFYIKMSELILAPFEVIDSWSIESSEEINVYCHCSFFDEIEDNQWESIEWVPMIHFLESDPMKNVDLALHKYLFALSTK